MKEILLLIGVVMFWYALQRYILPYFGVHT